MTSNRLKCGIDIHTGDCRDVLSRLPEKHFHCCVTSPPYFGLRDYGVEGQIGLEPTPAEFVAAMLDVFLGVWRVLRDDGVCWLNLGDSYNTGSSPDRRVRDDYGDGRKNRKARISPGVSGMKPKDMLGIPWTVALALRDAGWYLRDAVIWQKPSPMPGRHRDRCTSAYEFIFQLTKKPQYFFDMEAIKEYSEPSTLARLSQDVEGQAGSDRANGGGKNNGPLRAVGVATRVPRNVWRISHEGFKKAHFATFPLELAVRCIKAATSERGCCAVCGAPWKRMLVSERVPTRPGKNNCSDSTGKANRDEKRHVSIVSQKGWESSCGCGEDIVPCRVLDPFAGAGTTGLAAKDMARHATMIELNPDYVELMTQRITRPKPPKNVSAVTPIDGQMDLFDEPDLS